MISPIIWSKLLPSNCRAPLFVPGKPNKICKISVAVITRPFR